MLVSYMWGIFFLLFLIPFYDAFYLMLESSRNEDSEEQEDEHMRDNLQVLFTLSLVINKNKF